MGNLGLVEEEMVRKALYKIDKALLTTHNRTDLQIFADIVEIVTHTKKALMARWELGLEDYMEVPSEDADISGDNGS